jgi:hypothetical protein
LKVVAKPIEMVAWFTKEGIPHPVKFRTQKEDKSYSTVKIDKVIHTEKEKLAGNHMFVFRCQSEINGAVRPFELKYEIGTCKWMLWKI